MKLKYTFDLRRLDFGDDAQDTGGGPCSITIQDLEWGPEMHGKGGDEVITGTGHEITAKMSEYLGVEPAAQMYNHGCGAIVEVTVESTYVWNPVNWDDLISDASKLMEHVDRSRVEIAARTEQDEVVTVRHIDEAGEETLWEFTHHEEYTGGGIPILSANRLNSEQRIYEIVIGTPEGVARVLHAWY